MLKIKVFSLTFPFIKDVVRKLTVEDNFLYIQINYSVRVECLMAGRTVVPHCI